MQISPRWIAERTNPESVHCAPTPAEVRCLTGLASAFAALAALSLAGCYSPMYGQQPYGQPYGQPAYQGTLPPGGMYAPGVAPGTSLGTPTYDGSSVPSTGTGAGGDAPPFYGSPTSSMQNKPVPSYYDDPAAGAASGTGGFETTTTPQADEQFQPPTTGAEPISLTREVRAIADQQYAYDTAGHRWLQGVVNYDPRDKSWGIVYSIDPSPTDPYYGYLTLVNDPRLSTLKDGDVVRLDGQVDPTRLDLSNRPSYAVQQITPISR